MPVLRRSGSSSANLPTYLATRLCMGHENEPLAASARTSLPRNSRMWRPRLPLAALTNHSESGSAQRWFSRKNASQEAFLPRSTLVGNPAGRHWWRWVYRRRLSASSSLSSIPARMLLHPPTDPSTHQCQAHKTREHAFAGIFPRLMLQPRANPRARKQARSGG